MKTFTFLAMAASLALLSGCAVAPAATTTTVTESASGTTTITTSIAPPALPVYEQPVAPGPGYLWTPGYWAWGDAAYYWVPGVWVLPPRVGVLWTPGWWGWSGGVYRWHAGYWGPTIGFYGGINYGFGYFGSGYVGGYWHGDQFYYNRAVNNVHNTRITNVYVQNVTHNTTINHVSYNGGSGGLTTQPSATETAALQQRHMTATPEQMRQHTMAVHERAQRYNPSGMGPAVYGSSRVSEHFNDPHAVRSPAEVHPQGHPASEAHHEPTEPRASSARVQERAAPIERVPETRAALAQETNPAREGQERAMQEHEMQQRGMQEREQVRHREVAQPQHAQPLRRAPHPYPKHREHEER